MGVAAQAGAFVSDNQGRWLEHGVYPWVMIPRGLCEALEAFVNERPDIKYSLESLDARPWCELCGSYTSTPPRCEWHGQSAEAE